MENGYEYYYLFGLDIPLEKYGLGRIRQLKLIDYLSKDVGIDGFYMPFIMNDVLINQMDNPKIGYELKSQLGSLTFLLTSCMKGNRIEIISMLLDRLKALYGTDDIKLSDRASIVIDDVIEVNDSNFDTLCNVVLESLKIDKSKIKFEQPDTEDPWKKELERRRREHAKAVNKDNGGYSLPNVINMIVHCQNNVDYNNLLSMTVYQLKNTFETLMFKNVSDINLQYKLSNKFDVKEEVKDWREKKIVKSSAIE